MSIWNTIKDAIFGSDAKADEAHRPAGGTGTQSPTGTAAPSSPSTPSSSPTSAPVSPSQPSPVGGSPADPSSSAPGAAAPQAGASSDVDVAAVLDKAAAKSGQDLDWRHSIVDLMKALGLDSSLHNRQELADELGYSGDKHDSAAMNTWLHKQVIEKLKANGGRVPAELN